MPPRDPQPANSRRKSKPKLDVQEPALTKMLDQYCDLRRRGFGQQAIQTKASWPKHYPKLLLEEATRHQMPGSEGSQEQAVTEWLLQMFEAGTELRVIQRASALSNLQPRIGCKPPSTTRAAQPRPASSSRILTESQPGYLGWTPTQTSCTGRSMEPSQPITRKNAPYGNVQRSFTVCWAVPAVPPVIALTTWCSWQRLACTHSTTTKAGGYTQSWEKPAWTRTRSAPSS